MKKPEYLSPTSIQTWSETPEEFFLRYVVRVPRNPQTVPMAVGNAFDACVKAFLTLGPDAECKVDSAKHVELYQEYFEDTVEPQCRDACYQLGIIIFNMYKKTGLLEHIVRDMVPGTCRPLDKLQGVVEGVPILGKPDLMYESVSFGCYLVDDWKCNGAVSTSAKSPTPGFVDLWPSRSMHPKCMLNKGCNTLDIHEMYERQLTIYKLLTDAEVVGIQQLVFGATPKGAPVGELRVALHRHRVSKALEHRIVNEAKHLWGLIENYERGQPFGCISAERCEQLFLQGEVFEDEEIRFLTGRG